jgi:predicted lipid carrier protein YhbT
MAPYDYIGADTEIVATFDNLYNMAIGTASADRLFVRGQLKVKGNLSKGAELRHLIEPKKEE